MTDIQIKQKVYKNLETLTLSKLEHIRELLLIEIVNYQPFVLTAAPRRKLLIDGHNRRLHGRLATLEAIVKSKRDEVSSMRV